MSWQPIETAPKDELILVGPTKRMGICVAMNHSRDGWVTETPGDWNGIYTPTHWQPLPEPPGISVDPVSAMHSALSGWTDEQRATLFGMFCGHCGSLDPRCQCWNDE